MTGQSSAALATLSSPWHAKANKYRALDQGNTPLVRAINSMPLLPGRTVIVTAVEPSVAA